MPLLRVDQLKLMYGATEVLSNLTFQVEPRQRLGIVGANGSGKSSLLKAISGEVSPAAGSVTLAPRTRTAYLAQELEAGPHDSVYADALHSRPDILGLRARLEGLEAAMARATGAEQAVLVEDYGEVQHEYERLDGYAYDNRVAEVLHGVGLSEADQALAPGALSGGQRRRLALAKLLLQDADLLLLDEPTNHLDLEAIEWLEGFLRLSRAGMLIVSHDRRFLEHTADDILELQAGSGEWYPGNYRQYVRLRRERRALRQKEYIAQQEYIARTEEFIRRYKAGQRAREARGRQTRLDRLARVAPPADDQQIRIRLRASVTSDLIFQSDGLTLSYPSPFGGGSGWGLKIPAFTVNAGERIAIVGPNGSGKTSLLKALLGELRPLSGRVKAGPRVAMRYYDQHLADLDPNKTVLTELQDAFGLPEETLRTFLGRLLFHGDDAFKTIRSLSGGEKSRVALAKLMLDDAGLLLLDEPTNHLDLDAILWLEAWLRRYAGTLIVVSHDRDFLDEVVETVVHIDARKLKRYSGNYSAFEAQRAAGLVLAQAQYEKQQRERAHLQSFIDRFRAKATKARQAQSRMKMLARMEELAPVHAAAPFSFEFREPLRSPDPLLVLEDIDAGYGDKAVLGGVKLTLRAGERIGLLGVNGAGKTTLIKTIAGSLAPLGGSAVLNKGVVIGYFAQHQVEMLRDDQSPLWHLARLAPGAREQELRDYLGSFNFPGDMATGPVEHFSGGEKARLALALIVWQRPNLLLLDEPTNHLDLETREALTVALAQFEGTLVLVSHDRHLLRASTEQLVIVRDGRVVAFDGDLEDYRQSLLQRAAPPPKPALRKPSGPKGSSKKSLQSRIQRLEEQMKRLGAEISAVEGRLGDPATYRDAEAYKALAADRAYLRRELDQLETEWLARQAELEN